MTVYSRFIDAIVFSCAMTVPICLGVVFIYAVFKAVDWFFDRMEGR